MVQIPFYRDDPNEVLSKFRGRNPAAFSFYRRLISISVCGRGQGHGVIEDGPAHRRILGRKFLLQKIELSFQKKTEKAWIVAKFSRNVLNALLKIQCYLLLTKLFLTNRAIGNPSVFDNNVFPFWGMGVSRCPLTAPMILIPISSFSHSFSHFILHADCVDALWQRQPFLLVAIFSIIVILIPFLHIKLLTFLAFLNHFPSQRPHSFLARIQTNIRCNSWKLFPFSDCYCPSLGRTFYFSINSYLRKNFHINLLTPNTT